MNVSNFLFCSLFGILSVCSWWIRQNPLKIELSHPYTTQSQNWLLWWWWCYVVFLQSPILISKLMLMVMMIKIHVHVYKKQIPRIREALQQGFRGDLGKAKTLPVHWGCNTRADSNLDRSSNGMVQCNLSNALRHQYSQTHKMQYFGWQRINNLNNLSVLLQWFTQIQVKE